jgi:nucleoid-associated protein YgaU
MGVMAELLIVIESANSKLEFNEKDGSRVVKAKFNPNRLTVSRSVRWEDQQTPKRDNPEMQFTGADASTLSMDLFFDTYDTDEAKKTSVRTYTDKLRGLTTVEQHGDKHRPPVCRLVWGQQATFFQGVLTQLETQFTMFMDDGTPVRATNRCTFKQWRSNTSDLQKQDLLSSDVAKVWVVKQGQTLADIAAREYGDPRQWRVIADANRIDDPSVLTIGRRLVLPARRIAWQRSWEP